MEPLRENEFAPMSHSPGGGEPLKTTEKYVVNRVLLSGTWQYQNVILFFESELC